MNSKTVSLEKRAQIATITLNRPERRNALNDDMLIAFQMALGDVAEDDDVRVVVLRGAGSDFSVGGDTKSRGKMVMPYDHVHMPKELESVRQGFRRGMMRLTRCLYHLEKPTIAQVNGVALGGGHSIALSCDLRIGSKRTRFIQGYTRIALVPEGNDLWLLSRIVGVGKAAEILYLSHPITGEDAYRIGLLNWLVSDEKLDEETMAVANEMANNAPLSMKIGKLMLNRISNLDYDSSFEMVSAVQPFLEASRDHREAIAAFLKKREPQFRGW